MEQELGFRQAVVRVFRNYVTFSGRARRAEFWWWLLFLVLVDIGCTVLDGLVFGTGQAGRCGFGMFWGNWVFMPGGEGFCAEAHGGPVTFVWNVATFLPTLALWSRRLHDRDHSFWWFLWVVVPMVGWFVLLIGALRRGTRGDNRFGPDPVTTPGPGGPTSDGPITRF